jgi:hypothetical protein
MGKFHLTGETGTVKEVYLQQPLLNRANLSVLN